MKNQFVSYEQSLTLKQLGFDELCFGYYDNMRSFAKNYVSSFIQQQGEPFTIKRNSEIQQLKGYTICTAPLKQQAFEWFIDKHGLHIHMCPEFYKDGINYCWQILWYLPKDKWTDSNVHGGTMFYGDNHEYPTKEEAENACIDKMIEIVKNK